MKYYQVKTTGRRHLNLVLTETEFQKALDEYVTHSIACMDLGPNGAPLEILKEAATNAFMSTVVATFELPHYHTQERFVRHYSRRYRR